MLKLQVPVLSTILSDAEPLTEDEKRHLAEEWRTRTLDFLLFEAFLNDKDFGRILCERVGSFARGDKALADVLKKALGNDQRGRPTDWNLSRYKTLLLHYAHAIDGESNGDHNHALNILAGYEKRMSGNYYPANTLDNQISKGIKALEAAGELDGILNIADWVRDAIQKRIGRGKKSKKRTTTTHKEAAPLLDSAWPSLLKPRSSK